MNNKFIWFINKNQLQWNRGKWKLSLNVTHLVSHGFHVLSKSLNFAASSYKFQSMIMNRRFVILSKQTKQCGHCVLQSIFCQLLNFFFSKKPLLQYKICGDERSYTPVAGSSHCSLDYKLHLTVIITILANTTVWISIIRSLHDIQLSFLLVDPEGNNLTTFKQSKR